MFNIKGAITLQKKPFKWNVFMICTSPDDIEASLKILSNSTIKKLTGQNMASDRQTNGPPDSPTDTLTPIYPLKLRFLGV